MGKAQTVFMSKTCVNKKRNKLSRVKPEKIVSEGEAMGEKKK